MPITARAILFPAPHTIDFTAFDLPPCGEQEIVAETIYTFVSPGTELRVLAGTSESQGRFPFIPGYAWVGRIIKIGSAVKGWRLGDLVTGRNPLPIPGITQPDTAPAKSLLATPCPSRGLPSSGAARPALTAARSPATMPCLSCPPERTRGTTS